MDQPQDTIDVACNQCGEKFRLPRSAIGRTGKCKCGNVLMIRDSQQEIESLRSGFQKLLDQTANNCTYHPDQPSAQKCVKCQKPLCTECALKTKSGSFVCRPCLDLHRGKSSTPHSPIKSAASESVSSDLTAKPIIAASVDAKSQLAQQTYEQSEEVYEAEVIEPDNTFPSFPPEFNQQTSHYATQQFPLPQSGWGGQSASNQWTAYSAAGVQDHCRQHPEVPAVHHCTICREPVCRTCVFVFPPNITACPKCAANNEIRLSPSRKWMIYTSLGCAIGCTLLMALTCSGLLSALEGLPFVAFFLVILQATLVSTGLGLAFGSLNRTEGNTITLWVAGVWNLLAYLAWCSYLILVAFM